MKRKVILQPNPERRSIDVVNSTGEKLSVNANDMQYSMGTKEEIEQTIEEGKAFKVCTLCGVSSQVHTYPNPYTDMYKLVKGLEQCSHYVVSSNDRQIFFAAIRVLERIVRESELANPQ